MRSSTRSLKSMQFWAMAQTHTHSNRHATYRLNRPRGRLSEMSLDEFVKQDTIFYQHLGVIGISSLYISWYEDTNILTRTNILIVIHYFIISYFWWPSQKCGYYFLKVHKKQRPNIKHKSSFQEPDVSSRNWPYHLVSLINIV